MPKKTPEEAARSILSSYLASEASEVSIPVDPVRIARALGINVYAAKLENSLSGMIAKLHADPDIDIYLNSEHAPVRQRFTCAHELGHYFAMRESGDLEKKQFVHKRDNRAACGTYAEEIYANKFAAELLMPEREVRRLHKMGLDDIGLSHRFDVSVDAMTYRLKNLYLVE
ncbi:ImmA/IrrE family metallo-endopeptidase [Clavibacter sp. CFBP 8614]|uniref:ImmA/IrrE family metallo-endopeptidase n=1 Tax=unclassified Clavibacter TaxID=2626594 RepID=UPI004041872A